MSTKIEWTEEVWNPVAGCWPQSPGCAHCYAERMAKRLAAMGRAPYADSEPETRILTERGRWSGNVWVGGIDLLSKPMRWRDPKTVFVNSMSDLFQAPLFGENCETDAIDRIFAVMAMTPRHTYQVLTKRADLMYWYLTTVNVQERILRAAQDFRHELAKSSDGWSEGVAVLNGRLSWPLPNVWMGVSVEDQQRANIRIPLLQRTPATVRFLSCEPLLGHVDINAANNPDYNHIPPGFSYFNDKDIHWVICGGESGPRSRPMNADWVRSLRDQCQEAEVAFFFKQWGGVRKKTAGRLLDGREWNEMPNHPGAHKGEGE